MSIITKIEVQAKDKNRANLYLDDEFFMGISIELCMRERLKKGVEIDEEKLKILVLEEEKGVAFDKSLKYVSGNLKTTKQVKEYLRGKGYNPQTVEYVINKLQEYKYLDDEHYAKSFILTYSKKYGRLKLVSALKSKGIDPSIIDNIYEDGIDAQNNIELVASKYMKNKIADQTTLLKLNRFLASRGYEYSDIYKVIDKLKEE